jgi:hypothetical protein
MDAPGGHCVEGNKALCNLTSIMEPKAIQHLEAESRMAVTGAGGTRGINGDHLRGAHIH